MSRTSAADTVPGERDGFAHHPPVLFLNIQYAHDLGFDPSETGPVVCTSLSESMKWGRGKSLNRSIVDNFELWFAIVLIPIYYQILVERIPDGGTSMWLTDFDPRLIPAYLDRNGCVHTRVDGAPALENLLQHPLVFRFPHAGHP